ncbi:MAG TPA: YncE family protein [Burkholderiales bacterium]|nr:YncE family protein [Burkholderiales bacterium]
MKIRMLPAARRFKTTLMRTVVFQIAVAAFMFPVLTAAQVVGVVLDPKPTLADGAVSRIENPGPDSVVFLEFSGAKAKRLGQANVPTSFFGPPSSVAVSADKTLALATSSRKADPNDPKKFVPDNKLSVIDLKTSAPAVLQTLELPFPPMSIALNPQATMALAMHTDDDSVTVLSIADGKVSVVETFSTGKGSGPHAAAFSPGGKHVLLTRGSDNRVALYVVESDKLRMPPVREMGAGVRPFAVSFCGTTGLAVVSNLGANTGDQDTLSLIDLSINPPRIIDTITVGPVPEGAACAPDGRHAAVAIQNMANRPASNPFKQPTSKVVLIRIDNKKLTRVSEAPIGVWSQGVGFLDDSRTLFGQSVMDKAMHFFRIEGNTLKSAGPPMIFDEGAPVAFGVAGR